ALALRCRNHGWRDVRILRFPITESSLPGQLLSLSACGAESVRGWTLEAHHRAFTAGDKENN
ncbi:hypothetical protein D8L93_05010, partial [Sodalis-like symbiont of Bactericera trigonica]